MLDHWQWLAHSPGMYQSPEELGLLEDEEIELDLAALMLSALDHQGTDLAPYLDLIGEISERLALTGADCDEPAGRAEALSRVFAHDFGFTGDADAYGAPVNADLMRVLERRQGLPVSLSILYVAAARRMGWAAYALNLPGHVLVRLGDERFMLIDPFGGGVPVSRDQLGAMVRQFMGADAQVLPEYLAPVPNRVILVRLLRNQASRAEQAGDFDRALILHERMSIIASAFPDVWWQRAMLQLRCGRQDGARESLSAMLEVTRDAATRQLAVDALDTIARQSR